uniref:Uncharacterized protein n=1 Tax=Anguilla anguilla TaxID=7936 RepID=A0A0E9SZ01_ANGAN
MTDPDLIYLQLSIILNTAKGITPPLPQIIIRFSGFCRFQMYIHWKLIFFFWSTQIINDYSNGYVDIVKGCYQLCLVI